MLILGIALAVLVGIGTLAIRRRDPAPAAVNRPVGAYLATAALTLTAVAAVGITANAAIVPTVDLATSSNYAVLGSSTVTNTGATVLNGSLGLSPGTDVTGFPPGIVVPPATIDVDNAAAAQAQSDLTVAYVDAAGRPVDATTTADLTDLILVGGVYAGPGKGALELTGPLILDGEGNANSVFIFQTDSTLITATGSTVSLINGAQACNVFWQVGSSATLGEDSVFVGNILALTSITVGSNVVVEGRALARNGAVTLINDTFTAPECRQDTTTTVGDTTTTTSGETTTTTSGDTTTTTSGDTTTTVGDTTTTTSGDTTTTVGDTTTTTSGDTTTTVGDTTTTTSDSAGPATTAADESASTTIVVGAATTTVQSGMTTTTLGGTTTTAAGNTTTTVFSGQRTGDLPVTGSNIMVMTLLAILAIVIGAVAVGAGRAASKR